MSWVCFCGFLHEALLTLAMRSVLGATVAAAMAVPAWAQQPHAVLVTKVFDGDTFVVQGSRDSVRLANVDAPKTAHRGRLGQPFSTAPATT
jgi:endonuclease YncB( thermonuclease family)